MCETIFLLALHAFKVWQKQLYIYILIYLCVSQNFRMDELIICISYRSTEFCAQLIEPNCEMLYDCN